MKKLFIITIFLMSAIWSFAQTEWTAKYYEKGDTVKVGEVVYVANRSFNSASQPPNSYWTLVSGTNPENKQTYSVEVSVNYKPITDSILALEKRIKALESGIVGSPDLSNIYEDIGLIKQELENLVFLPNVTNELTTRLEIIEQFISTLPPPKDYTTEINNLKNTHSSDVQLLNERINNIPAGNADIYISGLPYSASSLAIEPGVDVTTRLNQLVNPIIIFDAGTYIINGHVNLNGKTIKILPGSKFDGIGTLSGGVIEAGDHHVFGLNINISNCRVNGDKVYWTWFGATPNNENDDDRPALQKGIDIVIANPGFPRTFYGSSGYYHIDNGLVVYKWDGVDYRFCDIRIEGEPESWKNSEEYGTWIWQRNPQAFGINFQRVRSSGVKNVNLRGQAMYENHYGSYEKLFKAPFDTYTSEYNTAQNKNILDTRFAMHAAVVIDGFANGPLFNGTWPGWESWNRGTQQTGGSSGVTISHAYIYGWVIGEALSPSGTTYNAEHIYSNNIFYRSNKVAVSVGQDQNKNIPIENVEVYNCHTAFDGLSYGKGIGAHVFVNYASMSNTQRLVNISSQRFGSSFSNIITEEFYRIGDIDHGGNAVIFNNLQFEYKDNASNILKGNNVVFNGGYIRTQNAPTFTRPVFQGSNITFNQITLENAPIFPGTVETTNGNQNGYFHQVNLLAWESRLGATSVSSQNLEPFRNYPLYGDFTISSQMVYPGASVKISYNETKYDFSYRLGGGDLSNIVKGTADFKIQHPSVYPLTGVDVNDHLITDLNGSIQAIGRVTSVNHATGEIKLTDVPDNLVPGNYITWGNYIRRVQRPFMGDVTANSNKIENILSPFGLPSVGDRIETYVDFSNNSVPIYIISVDGTTATTSRPMLHTATSVNFAMGDPVISVLSVDPYDKTNKIFLNGTEFKTKK